MKKRMSIKAARSVFAQLGVPKSIIKDVLMPYVSRAVVNRQLRMAKLKNDKFTVLIGSQNRNKAVILHEDRTNNTVHQYVYDFVSKTMTSGQWLRGKKVFSFDLSPDGKYMIYGLQYRSKAPSAYVDNVGIMTVICKPPYFSGLYCLEDTTIPYMPYSKEQGGGRWCECDVEGQYVIAPIGAESKPRVGQSVLPDNIVVLHPKKYDEIYAASREVLWKTHTVNELKDELFKRGLPRTGPAKAVLVQRLVESDVRANARKPRHDGSDQRVEVSHNTRPPNCDIVVLSETSGRLALDNGFFVLNGEKIYDFTDDAFECVAAPDDYGW
jgi:hypothetical protein